MLCIKVKGAPLLKIAAEKLEDNKSHSDLVAKDGSGKIMGKFKRSDVVAWCFDGSANDPIKEIRKFLNGPEKKSSRRR
jgi:hypothetical protein